MSGPNAIASAPAGSGANIDRSRTKLIAFYLPQYHPIPENDEWWGKGFTEWTNVVKARPLFRGHYQPHLPADLGFYDLRLTEAREAQAALAKKYGIYGFCYYHYWFNGRRLLERPFNEVLNSGNPVFPFCLCWANENWTRRWDGREQQILMEQTYSPQDDLNHIRWLVRAFLDPRYIRVEGKPLFLVYRVGNLPSPAQTAQVWRDEARKAGVGEIFLCSVESNFAGSQLNPSSIGFDAAVEFQPSSLPAALGKRAWGRLLRTLGSKATIKYAEVVRRAMQAEAPSYLRFRCVTPSWDNTARRKAAATVLAGSSPEQYSQWLSCALRESPRLQNGDKFLFVNAWNEWAEGNHLEPCQRWQLAYLEATRLVIESSNDPDPAQAACSSKVQEP
jgi:lipopolysaccharide biosynthesis protein